MHSAVLHRRDPQCYKHHVHARSKWDQGAAMELWRSYTASFKRQGGTTMTRDTATQNVNYVHWPEEALRGNAHSINVHPPEGIPPSHQPIISGGATGKYRVGASFATCAPASFTCSQAKQMDHSKTPSYKSRNMKHCHRSACRRPRDRCVFPTLLSLIPSAVAIATLPVAATPPRAARGLPRRSPLLPPATAAVPLPFRAGITC